MRWSNILVHCVAAAAHVVGIACVVDSGAVGLLEVVGPQAPAGDPEGGGREAGQRTNGLSPLESDPKASSIQRLRTNRTSKVWSQNRQRIVNRSERAPRAECSCTDLEGVLVVALVVREHAEVRHALRCEKIITSPAATATEWNRRRPACPA